MVSVNPDSEEALERATIELFEELGYEHINCYKEIFGCDGTLGRETSSEVVLISRLYPALERLNKDLPKEAIQVAIDELIRDRSTVSPVQANREIYELIKNGVKVEVPGAHTQEESVRTVKVIDWDNQLNNDFLLTSQLWITGEIYTRRADLVGFVNGLPLIFIELKASHKRLKNAFNNNLRDYKNVIPQLFWYNAFIILSNGSQSRIGSTTASWEHFAEWKKINSEGEEGVVSLDTMIRGTCKPSKLLDVIENFTVYSEASQGLVKLVAKNHQYLGVNNAVRALQEIDTNKGRLGVFWHTQGSGKSYSMVFFAQKVLRKLPGNYTFLIVTDRQELDDQIYKVFARAGAVTENQIQADSGENLKQLLKEDHRYVFTLIQKFRTERGGTYPMLSDRSDIIVITDEAHRSQYDIFALNMRNALPNAAFIGFTGTPLMVGEEKTREVFGDYVSIYNFKQSIDDGATVPLYYENRIPELQLINESFNEDMERLLEEAELDEAQEKKLEREFGREYHLITRDDRLEKVAEDIVGHFLGRGQEGKAMVVSIDKATAVRMYDKVKKHWALYIDDLRSKLTKSSDNDEREYLTARIKYMEETDMAVVVSQAQNEVEDFREIGLDILPHRMRMINEDLETKFKDEADPFRIVFVCAMWMTGFDVPSCSTIYLDKPMKNHTLMQTIARANRVYKDKMNGMIVDYAGIFRNLQKALAIYGSDYAGGIKPGEVPVKDKKELVEMLRLAITEAEAFCKALDIDLNAIHNAQGFERIKLRDDAVEAILVNDETKKKFFYHANIVDRIYRAILPDPLANEFAPVRQLLVVVKEKMQSDITPPDISNIMDEVEALLDRSIASKGYVIHEAPADSYGKKRLIDLSTIDFEALKKHFEKGRKRTEVEKLKNALAKKLEDMIYLNNNRIDFMDKFQRMIDEYNAGSLNIEMFFDKLVQFAKELNEEDKRAIAEGLTEEELTIFDLLTKPDMKMSKKEEQRVKKIAHDLLLTLKKEKLVLDWRKKQQARAAVRLSIEEILDQLPRVYTPSIYKQKCDAVYQHVYEAYFGQNKSVYSMVG